MKKPLSFVEAFGFASARQLLALGACLCVAFSSASSAQQSPSTSGYTVVELPMLGGTVGGAVSINDAGWISGFANVPGDRTEHASLWVNGVIRDLGTLGGPNSAVGFPVKNADGMLVGFSQTADAAPLHEGWTYTCTVDGQLCQGNNLITLGFAWQDGSNSRGDALAPKPGGLILNND